MPETRALVKTRAAPGAELLTLDTPPLGPRDILVRVRATSICGTDLHLYRWDPWAESRMKPPRRMGHEMSGDVVEVGSAVTLVKPGDYVSADSHITCGVCYQCRTGRSNVCANMAILGVDVDGCFGDYTVIPESSAWKNDPSLPPEVACIQDPLGNAVYATLVEDVAGRSVAIFGCGPTGLFAAAVAQASGASSILCVDPNEFRLGLVGRMGATRLVRSGRDDVVRTILDATGGVGADAVLEMSGSPEAISQGFEALSRGGRFTAFGLPKEPLAEFDMANQVIFKGARVYGITGREMFDTWFRMAALLRSGSLDPTPAITHSFPLEQYRDAFDLLLSPDGRVGKVVLIP